MEELLAAMINILVTPSVLMVYANIDITHQIVVVGSGELIMEDVERAVVLIVGMGRVKARGKMPVAVQVIVIWEVIVGMELVIQEKILQIAVQIVDVHQGKFV